MKGSSEVKVGDVVVVHSEDKHRGFWKLGRIERVLSSQDGEIRGAVARVHQGGNRTTLLKRPIQRLYPIEVRCNTITTHEDGQIDQEPDLQIDQITDDTNQDQNTDDTNQRRAMEGDSNSENMHSRRSSRARDRILACQHQL